MFSYLKRKFSPLQGTLSENTKDLFVCTYNITAGRIIFTSLKEERSFQISKIYNFSLINNTISFSYTTNNYVYKSDTNLKELFNLIENKTDSSKLFEGKVFFNVLEDLESKKVILVLSKENIKIDNIFYEFKSIVDLYVEKKDNKVFFISNNRTYVIRFEDSFDFLKFISFLKVSENQFFTETDEKNFSEEEISNEIFVNTSKINESKNDGILTAPNNLLFVSRGDALGIFNTSEEGLTHKTTIMNGLEDSLSKMKLFNNQILLQDKNQKELKLLDLHKEQICEKYDTKSNLTDYFCDANNCNAITKDSLMNLDFRTKEVVVEKKEYKTDPKFLTGSLRDNKIVVGSSNGDIRIFDKVGKRAKELMKGYGDEVLFVDQFDIYSVVTYKEYILLCFDKKRVKLTLKQEHIAFINQEINFTPCKFSPNGERLITSTNNYLISWKISDILNNLKDEFVEFPYRIMKYNENVVGDGFKFEDPSTIYVVLPDDIKKTEIKMLGSMEREMYKRRSNE